jgi:tRNA pseudouridine55 synthase
MDGIILIRKPPDVTSHDVVKQIRRLFVDRKVGHFGTLDPMATGLLLVAVGTATRLFPFFVKLDKCYAGKIRLGYSTDTYDATGDPKPPRSPKMPDPAALESALERFRGTFRQLPPPFSAKKHKGQPLYRLARAKKPTPLSPATVTVHRFRCERYDPPDLDVTVCCSSGTYIRSLAHDLGGELGCGAHLARLERTEVGPFSLEDGFELDQIRRLHGEDRIRDFMIPNERLLPHFPRIILTEEGSALAGNGNLILPGHVERVAAPEQGDGDPESFSDTDVEVFRLFNRKGRLLAFARRSPRGGLHPFLVIDRPGTNR